MAKVVHSAGFSPAKVVYSGQIPVKLTVLQPWFLTQLQMFLNAQHGHQRPRPLPLAIAPRLPLPATTLALPTPAAFDWGLGDPGPSACCSSVPGLWPCEDSKGCADSEG